MTSQQRLLSDISHELRTPLTRLQLGTALLRRRSGESKELERIETEAQRLDSMINDLLVMSRNQQKNALVSETLKANQLWGEVLDNAAFEAEQMGKSFTVNFPPGPWPLYGNPNALESALENIVRNALRYSHTKIEVGFAVDKDGITITVDDDGPGVSGRSRADFPSGSIAPMKRAIVNLAVQVLGWRLSKPPSSSIVAGLKRKTARWVVYDW